MWPGNIGVCVHVTHEPNLIIIAFFTIIIISHEYDVHLAPWPNRNALTPVMPRWAGLWPLRETLSRKYIFKEGAGELLFDL